MSDAPRCKRKTSASGYTEQCKNAPVKGATVCHKHGGSAPQVREAGKRRLQMQRAARAAETLGLPKEVDPHEGLLEQVYVSAGICEWYAERVRELDPDAVVWGKGEERGSVKGDRRSVERTERAGVSVWVQLYAEERDRLVRFCKTAIAAGLGERQVRLAEQQARFLSRVIRDVVAGLARRFGFDPDAPEAAEIARGALELVAANEDGDPVGRFTVRHEPSTKAERDAVLKEAGVL